jgi:DNA-binding CsgD family transcriptional regulator
LEVTARSSPPSPEKRLRDAIAAVPGDHPFVTLGEVARAIPIPLGVETIGIRLRAQDGEKLFHLLAMDGASPREISRRALEPFSLALIRSLFVLGPEHSLSRGLGHRWVGGRWIFNGKEALGVLTAGTRTDRKPTHEQEQLFTEVATELGPAIRSVDRSTKTLERASALLARDATEPPARPNPALESLRPRERTILAHYAEGLSAEAIGRMLFISPHTARTHVKHALRRLGVHSRDEAARLVHTDEVARIV